MVKLIWTEISQQDLKDLYDYISKDSRRYASITVNKIYQRAQDITTNPNTGRIVPEFNDKLIREVITGNYRIVYLIVTKSQVHILRVYHYARFLSDDKLS